MVDYMIKCLLCRGKYVSDNEITYPVRIGVELFWKCPMCGFHTKQKNMGEV